MSPAETGDEVVACTICTDATLPRAMVLAASYRQHHPAHRFVIAVLDAVTEPAGSAGLDERVELVPAAAQVPGDGEWARLATGYQPHELAAALKPFLLRRLLERAEVAVYLDPSMWVLAPLPVLAEVARLSGAVFTPYLTRPVDAGFAGYDEAALVTGRLAPGLVAVGAGAAGLLDAWAEAAADFTLTDPNAAPFADQRWLDRVAATHPHRLLTDESVHTACWNAFQRERVTPRLLNFAGYQPERPGLLSAHAAHRPRTLLSEHPRLRELTTAYREALLAAGYRAGAERTPSWLDELADGTTVNPLLRWAFRVESARRAEQARTGLGGREDPLPADAWADASKPFIEWLATPADSRQAGAGMTRWAMLVHGSRPDLGAVFPEPFGADGPGYRQWCRDYGVSTGHLAAWALPAEPEPPGAPEREFGVNLIGHLTAEVGVGELARTVHRGLRAAGIPVASVVEDRFIRNRAEVAAPADSGEPRFGVTLSVINADLTAAAAQWYPAALSGRYRIGLWSWELDEFPAALHPAFEQVDEVWTISEFCAEAIAAHTDKPVRVFPIPVLPPAADLTDLTDPAAPEGPPRFLFAFDFNSHASRKNPLGLVEAFRLAFPENTVTPEATLVIKAINGTQHPAAAEELRAAVAADERITLLEHYLSRAELDRLYREAHCYVSLHRAEGFGFTIAEAMARGLPVIYTDYSGNTEFQDPAHGWPVPWERVPVGPGAEPYPAGAHWAEPELARAAEAMRAVAADPVAAAERGAAGRDALLRNRSLAAAGEWLDTELRAAHQRWLDGLDGTGEHEQADAEASSGLLGAREALRWRAEVDAPSRLPGARLLRRAVLRAIDHYDVHNRRTLGAVLDGVESTVAEVAGRLASVEARLADRDRRPPE